MSSGKQMGQLKRPFLRKNQGHAAWCSRLRQPERTNVSKSPRMASLSPGSSQQNEVLCSVNGEVTKSFAHTCEMPSARNASDAVVRTKCSSADLQEDVMSGSLGNGIVADDSFNDRELEEFEMLERLAENHGGAMIRKSECKRNEFIGLSSRLSRAALPANEYASFPDVDRQTHMDKENSES